MRAVTLMPVAWLSVSTTSSIETTDDRSTTAVSPARSVTRMKPRSTPAPPLSSDSGVTTSNDAPPRLKVSRPPDGATGSELSLANPRETVCWLLTSWLTVRP